MNEKKPHRFINGAKGAVSLFLIVLMLPFVQIASALITAQRFNAAVATLEEMMSSSMHSTLAGYDGFVSDRFGLMSTAQSTEVDEVFDTFIDYNFGVLPGAYAAAYETSLEGLLPLTDNKVLRTQIDEYAKYNAPILLINQFLNIGELIKTLEKSLKITNLLSAVSSGMDACTEIIDYTKKVDALKDLSDEIYDLIADYDSAHSTFKSSITTLAGDYAALESLQESLAEAQAAHSEENDMSATISSLQTQIANKRTDISNDKTAAETAKTTYSDLHGTLVEKITQYHTDISAVLQSLENVGNKITNTIASSAAAYGDSLQKQEQEAKEKRRKEVDAEIQQMSQTLGEDKYQDSHYWDLLNEKTELGTESNFYGVAGQTITGFQNLANGAMDDYEKTQGVYDPAVIEQLIADLESQQAKVDAYSIDGVNKDTTAPTGMHMSIEGIMTRDELTQLYESFDTFANEADNILGSLWEGIKDLVSSLVKLNLVYDPQLRSVIDADFYEENYDIDIDRRDAANPLATVINAVCDFLSAVFDLARVTKEDAWDLFAWFEAFWAVLESIYNLVQAMIGVLESLGNLILSLFNGSLFSNLFFTYYLVFNLPCRTDYQTGKAMTGYAYGAIPYSYHTDGLDNLPVIGGIASLINITFTPREATDKIFSGAELEYMIVGSTDEVENQCVSFGMLYILRLLCNIPVVSSPEVTALAAGPQAPVVYILYLLLEPFVDMVLLVNSAEVEFIKFTPFLSPTGIPKIIKSLTPIIDKVLGKSGTKDLQNSFANAIGYEGTIGTLKDDPLTKLISFNYKEYLFFVMFLFANEANELELYKNIIQMEGYSYYKDKNFSDFDIRKAFTAVEGSVEVQVNEFMPQLLAGDLFKVKRTLMRGY